MKLIADGIRLSGDDALILDKISLAIDAGEFVGLIGPNGAGKSSLLRVLAGLTSPLQGEVNVELATGDTRLLGVLAGSERAQRLAYLPQQETPAWPLAVEHLVGLGRAPWHTPMSGKSKEDAQAINRALALTELDHLRHRRITTLSGGELQRALLARVFAGEPELILADEPIAALDPYHQLHIMEILADHAQQGGSVLAALHDLNLAARYCSRLLLLHYGRLVAEGSPAEVLTPDNLAAVYAISAYVDCRDDGVVIIPRQRIDQAPSSMAQGMSP